MKEVTINLSCRSLTAPDLTPFLERWEQIPSNKTDFDLQLGFNRLGNEGVKIVAQFAASNPSITSLDLCFNSIGPEGAKHLANYIRGTSTLRTLFLSGNHLGPKGFHFIARALSTNNALTSLNLTGNAGLAEGIQHLANELGSNRTLSTLCLNGNKLGSQGIVHVGALLTPSSSIRCLKIGDNNICDAGLETLSRALSSYRKLESLQLSFNDITRNGMELFASTLTGYSTLESLELDNNKIGDEGIKYLVAVMPTLQISRLNVGFNSIGNEGLSVLFRALTPNKYLTHLVISGSTVTAESAIRISELLKYDETLVDFRMDKVVISPAGENNIAAGVAHNQNSRLMMFSGFHLGVALSRLGSPGELANMSNETALDFLRKSWAQRKSGMSPLVRGHSFGNSSISMGSPVAGGKTAPVRAFNGGNSLTIQAQDNLIDQRTSGSHSPHYSVPNQNTLSSSLTPQSLVQRVTFAPTTNDSINVPSSSDMKMSLVIPGDDGSANGFGHTSAAGAGASDSSPHDVGSPYAQQKLSSLAQFNNAPANVQAASGFAKLEKRIAFRPPSLSVPTVQRTTPGIIATIVDRLRKLALEPFHSSDLWALDQYYMSPPSRISSSSPEDPVMSSSSSSAVDDDECDEVEFPNTTKRKSEFSRSDVDGMQHTNMFGGIAANAFQDDSEMAAASPAKRKAVILSSSFATPGSSFARSPVATSFGQSSIPRAGTAAYAGERDSDELSGSLSSSAPKRNSVTVLSSSPLKRASNSHTLARIAYYPRVQALMLSIKGDIVRTLALLRQLRYLEDQTSKYKDLDVEDILLNHV